MRVNLVTVKERKYSILKTIELPCRPNNDDFLIVDEQIYMVRRVWIMDSFIAALVVPGRDDVQEIRNAIQTSE